MKDAVFNKTLAIIAENMEENECHVNMLELKSPKIYFFVKLCVVKIKPRL